MLLYRGDNDYVQKFDIEKTDNYHALFGSGLYLTNSMDVAKDYTNKGYLIGGSKFDGHSKHEVVAKFLYHLMKQNGSIDKYKEMKDGLQNQYYKLSSEIYREFDRELTEVESRKIFKQLTDELKRFGQKILKQAKKEFSVISKDLTIVSMSTGEFELKQKDDIGFVSVFDVPNGYVGKCYDVERPMAGEVITGLKSFLEDHNYGGDRILDLRDLDGNYYTFTDWIEKFKSEPTRYAWVGHNIGGKGVYPSFDEFRHGTHFGEGFFNDNDSREIFQKFGYVGFRYQGGIRMGGTANRGGGNIKHEAYVFWDVDYMNKKRMKSIPVVDGEAASGIESGLRSSAVLSHGR